MKSQLFYHRLVLPALLCAALHSGAQVPQYSFTATTHPYSNLSGAASLIPPGTDNQSTALQSIGFAFMYDGVKYTHFSASSNGFITLGAPYPGTGAVNDLSGCGLPLLAPLWDDLKTGSSSLSGVYCSVSGNAPARVLAVEWRNMLWDKNATDLTGAGTLSFQLRLYEGSNAISFSYRSIGGPVSSTAGASVGISSGPGANQGFLSVSYGLTGASVSSALENKTIQSKPVSGSVFSFTPPEAVQAFAVQLPGNLLPGAVNQPMLRISIPNPSGAPGLKVTSFLFNTDNTTSFPDIDHARLYSTGSSPEFSAAAPAAAPVTSPSGSFGFSPDAVLQPGDNYFWLAYDISPDAVSGNIAGARLSTFAVNSFVSLAELPEVRPGRIIRSLTDQAGITAPCTEGSRNWVQRTLYDGGSNIIMETRAYRDLLGRVSQVQQKTLSRANVLAVQPVYDAFGRPVLQTLPAPIRDTGFCHRSNFITNSQGFSYSYSDFDTGLKVNQPDVVNETSLAGSYYSNSNPYEAYVPSAEGFPYSRAEYYQDPLCRVKRVAANGNRHRFGSGHEKRYFYMSSGGELSWMYGYYNTYNRRISPSSAPSGFAGISADALKTIQVDENGLTTITYTSSSGQLIASCVSGQSSSCTAQTARHTLAYKGQRAADIHLPASKTGTLYLHLPVSGSTTLAAAGDIVYTIRDLDKGKTLVSPADYELVASGSSQQVVFYGTYAAKAGFFRISYEYTNAYKAANASAYPDSSYPNTTLSYELDYSFWTLNHYDKRGRLVKTVSPKGVDCSFAPRTGSTLNTGDAAGSSALVDSFFYNELNWMVKKSSADEGITEYKYDSEGKVRFSQNAKQRAAGRFSYTNYDRAGRVTETGEYAITASGLYYFDGTVGGGLSYAGQTGISTIADLPGGPEPAYCSQRNFVSYDIPATDLPVLSGYTQTHLLGRVSRTSNANMTSWYSYDELGRLRWMVQAFSETSVKTVDYTYNFQGNVTLVAYQKGTPAEALYHHYNYDADQRLLSVETSPNGLTGLAPRARYLYYLHGPLKRTELGGNLQGADYVYTINGWLKSINNAGIDPARDPGRDGLPVGLKPAVFSPDVFGMSLDYHDRDYVRNGTFQQTYKNETGKTQFTDHYNGLVKAMRWKTAEPVAASGLAFTGQNLMYGYNYDAYNRLTQAVFGTTTAGTQNGAPGDDPAAPELTEEQDYLLDNLSYDLNGNILSLDRKGSDNAGSTLGMDNLTYNYLSGSNRLDHLGDAAISSAYADDIKDQSAGNYQYNAIGEQTEDVKENNRMEYDVYGRVTRVRDLGTGALKMSYLYNASGYRVKKTVYDPSGADSSQTWYVSDAGGYVLSVYRQPSSTDGVIQAELPIYGLSRLGVIYNTNPMPAALAQAGININRGVYAPKPVFELTDHLGNVRATVSRSGGIVEILKTADYYPHGSVMPGRSYTSALAYRYDYQGQEKDENGWNAFELRMYDARTGRWASYDPYRQTWSPYAAMGNNPVSMIDPDGGHFVPTGVWEAARKMAQYLNYQTMVMTGMIEDMWNWVFGAGWEWRGYGGKAGNVKMAYSHGEPKGVSDQPGTWYNEYKRNFVEDKQSGETVYKLLGEPVYLGTFFEPQAQPFMDPGFMLGIQKLPVVDIVSIGLGPFGMTLSIPSGSASFSSTAVAPQGTPASQSSVWGEGTQQAGIFGDGKEWVGPALIGLGRPINALKPVGALGSKPGSSIASAVLRKVLPYNSSLIKQTTTYLMGRAASTSVLGAALGRMVPGTGWIITGFDAIMIVPPSEPKLLPNTVEHDWGWEYVCFKKGTLVYSDQGLIEIETVRKGSKVFSFNLENKKLELKSVINTDKRYAGEILQIKVATQDILVTEEHPFYVADKGWIKAKELKVKDKLFTSDETLLEIKAIEKLKSGFEVYNIEVEGNNNYFVTDAKILVHNKNISFLHELLKEKGNRLKTEQETKKNKKEKEENNE